jgi:hypothetical protein
MSKLGVQLDRKRRETPWLLILSALLFLASLVFNLLTWGPLSQVPKAGEPLAQRAGLDSPLAWTYLKLGRGITQLVGMPQFQVDAVTEAFNPALEKGMAEPDRAVSYVLAERSSFRSVVLQWSHYGCPVFLALWILFTLFRSDRLNTYNARR